MANQQIKTAVTSSPDVIGYKTGATTFFVICPHCGKKHTHGIAGGLGHRASDCQSLVGYEVLKIIQNEITATANRAPNRAQKRRN